MMSNVKGGLNMCELYNETYYKNCCGTDYSLEKYWTHFFGVIADRIVADFNPGSVLDAGCAWGYLVAALRDRGVEAYGVDISSYAINKVREDVKPYCAVCSLTESLPENFPIKYDLVTNIEVLEHMYEEEGIKAIRNLCNYSDTIIFSSTADDITEATHVNVQQSEYWIHHFAQNGFFNNLDYVPNYISSAAVCLRRNNNIARIAEDYERNIRILKSKTDQLKLHSLNIDFTSTILIDFGHGFQADNTIFIQSRSNVFCHQFNLESGVKSIRFDPVEGKGCIVQNLEIFTNNGELQAINLNGIKVDNFDIFTNTDPQILIEFKGDHTSWVKIKATIIPFEEMSWFILLSKFAIFQNNEREMTTLFEAKIAEKENEISAIIKDKDEEIEIELDYYKTLYESALKEIEDLNAKLLNISTAYQSISTSSIWRMTKPGRLLLDWIKILIKSNRMTWTLYRGLKYLKQNGFRNTWYKAKNRMHGELFHNKIANNNLLSEEEKQRQKQKIFDIKIKFSILVPLYNTPENYLKEMINSVITQTYNNWELCLADGSDNYNNIEKLCSQYNKKYKNIKYKKLFNNLGIAGNTIEAYNISSGDYIVLLDHDDFLTENALYEIACCIQEHPNVDFIYSDRAIFSDETKQILAYHFLPGYSPDFMRACNYASHLNAFSKHIINQVGFIRNGYDGSQDYDFELRVMEKAREIANIPKVLYYCRACEGSVALNPESKMYAYEAGRKAIEEHIQRLGYPGKVEFLPETYSYRIHYKIKSNEKIAIIIPNKDHVKDLKRCINSLLEKTSYSNYEIIIVENNSEEEETFKYYSCLEKNEKIKILYYPKKSFNFSDINNYAVSYVQTPYILFLNNDIEVINPNWLTEMLMFAQRDDVGAVGAKLYYRNETFQHIGLYIGISGHIASHYDHKKSRHETGYMHRLTMPQNYNALTAACLLIKRQDFIQVGGFDDVNFKIGLNDIDLCLKLRQLGKINVLTPYAELYHYESVSRGSDDNGESRKRFERETKIFRAKWSNYFNNGDEYLNPNFFN